MQKSSLHVEWSWKEKSCKMTKVSNESFKSIFFSNLFTRWKKIYIASNKCRRRPLIHPYRANIKKFFLAFYSQVFLYEGETSPNEFLGDMTNDKCSYRIANTLNSDYLKHTLYAEFEFYSLRTHHVRGRKSEKG